MTELARDRNALLKELLELTERDDFTNPRVDEAERMDAFAALYNKRAALMARLKDVNLRLDAALDEAAKRILAEGEPTLKRLIELDGKHREAAEKLMAQIKRRLKDLRMRRTASAAYNGDHTEPAGYLYDNSN